MRTRSSMRKLRISPTFSLFLLTFFSTFLVYLLTLPGHLVSFGDAAEFAVAALTNGIPHPPGYPLFVLLAKLAILLPFTNKIMLINGVSAVAGAATAGFVALILFTLTKSRITSFITALILGYSFLFWKYSTVSEVFTLNTFFAAALLLLALTITTRKGLFLTAILAGLSLSNHYSIVLTFPCLLFLIFRRKVRFGMLPLLISIPVFAIGLLPYLYLLWAGQQYPLMNWENPDNLNAVLNLMLRKAYTGTGDTVAYPFFHVQAQYYAEIVLNQFTVLGTLLFAAGAAYAFRQKKSLFWVLFLTMLLSGLLLLIYIKLPLDNMMYGSIGERFVLLPNIFFVVFIGLGIHALLQNASLLLGKKKQHYLPLFYLLIMMLPVFLLFTNFQKENQKQNMFTPNVADDVLAVTPKNAIVLMGGDVYYNALLYAYLVEKKRQDIILIEPVFFDPRAYGWYAPLLHRHFPDIFIPPLEASSTRNEYVAKFIIKNSTKRPVVCACTIAFQFLRVMPSKPAGPVDRYLLKPSIAYNLKKEEEEADKTQRALKNTSPPPVFPAHYIENDVLRDYSKPYLWLGLIYQTKGDYANAERLFKKALEVTPQNYTVYRKLADIYQFERNDEKELEALKMYVNMNPGDKNVANLQKRIAYLESVKK